MTKLKVSSPAELISAVPFLIGFHPADSLTVVAMRGTEIAFAVRADLPELGAPGEEAKAEVLHLASVVIRQQVQAVVIIGYGEERRVTPAVLRISEVFSKVGLVIIDELRVEDGRYWSFLCSDPACCPPQGLPCEPPDSVVAAEATFAGAVALPSRDVFAAQLTPVTGDDRAAMTTATARAVLRLATVAGADRVQDHVSFLTDESRFFAQVRRAGREAVREAERCYRSGGRLPDDEVAWLGLLLMHVPVRDYAWTRSRTADWELALWSDVVRRVEPVYTPAPASLLAFVAWRSGAGVLASVAVERALDEQEDYTLAKLVHHALTDGVHPAVLDGWPTVAGAPDSSPSLDEDPGDGTEPHAYPDQERTADASAGRAARPRVLRPAARHRI